MIDMTDCYKLTSELVQLDSCVTTKKQALRAFSEMAHASFGLEQSYVFSALYERELIGSTCPCEGIALPHAKIENLDDFKLMLLRLREPIQGDSSDWSRSQVKTIFCLLVPLETQALEGTIETSNTTTQTQQILARLSRQLKCDDVRSALECCDTLSNLNNLLSDYFKVTSSSVVLPTRLPSRARRSPTLLQFS